jgi:hypothetical protein
MRGSVFTCDDLSTEPFRRGSAFHHSGVSRSKFEFPIRLRRRILLSHVVTITTEVRDSEAVRAACQRLQLSKPQQGVFRLFSGEAAGLAVQLPGWRYPAVFNLATGQALYDNFQERWGAQVQLDRFLQMYAVEKSTRPQYPP